MKNLTIGLAAGLVLAAAAAGIAGGQSQDPARPESYEWTFDAVGVTSLKTHLNKRASEGWEFVQAHYSEDSLARGNMMIFRRIRR